MPRLSQRGAIQFIVLLILIVGIVGGIWLVTSGPLKIFPKASISGPITSTTSFGFSTQGTSFKVGDTIAVKVLVRSDLASANLFSAKINFNKDLLAIDNIDYSNTFISNWVEQYSDNSAGVISLVGGVPNPGYQTNTNNDSALMAVIYFKVLNSGNVNISFNESSAIYSNADNTNILAGKNPITLSLSSTQPTPTPTSQPSSLPSSTPSPAPVPGTGDANGDGKIDLVDLSILLSDFNKRSGFRKGIDMNGDGIINTFDFSLLRNLLIQRGVIRG